MASRRIYPSARGRIIEAAERVLLRDGVGSFSVDAVVVEADLSKGGFFYHFKTKSDLIVAIIESLHEQLQADVRAVAARDPHQRGRLLRALIRVASLIEGDEVRRSRMRALVRTLIAASIDDPAALSRVADLNTRAIAGAEADAIPVAQSLLVQLAMDGLWLGEALGTFSVPRARLKELQSLMLFLSRQDVGATMAPVASERGGPPREASPGSYCVERVFLAATAICLATSLSLRFPGPSSTECGGSSRRRVWSLSRWAALPLRCFSGWRCSWRWRAQGSGRGAAGAGSSRLAADDGNLLGDAGKAIVAHDPATAFGVPIAGALVLYLLSAPVRRFLRARTACDSSRSPASVVRRCAGSALRLAFILRRLCAAPIVFDPREGARYARERSMHVHVLFDDRCFDGAASAATFTRFYRDRIDPTATFTYRGMNHKAGSSYDPSPFTDAPVHACVDFRYSPSPS